MVLLSLYPTPKPVPSELFPSQEIFTRNCDLTSLMPFLVGRTPGCARCMRYRGVVWVVQDRAMYITCWVLKPSVLVLSWVGKVIRILDIHQVSIWETPTSLMVVYWTPTKHDSRHNGRFFCLHRMLFSLLTGWFPLASDLPFIMQKWTCRCCRDYAVFGHLPTSTMTSGITPNQYIAAGVIYPVVCLAFVVLRFWNRRLQGAEVTIDDWLIMPAWVSFNLPILSSPYLLTS